MKQYEWDIPSFDYQYHRIEGALRQHPGKSVSVSVVAQDIESARSRAEEKVAKKFDFLAGVGDYAPLYSFCVSSSIKYLNEHEPRIEEVK